ncbi:chitin-binding lectin 1-like [Tetranychus urticae]|nr:chitin-binding lectin 1-like [Tetranychus urticae]
MDFSIVCLLIIFLFTLDGQCFKKFGFFGSKGLPPATGDSQCTCTCRPQVQTRYVAIEVPKMVPSQPPPAPPPPPPPPPTQAPMPKKTHIISIQEVEIPIVKPSPPDSWAISTPATPPSWTDRRWDEELSYHSGESFDYGKMSKFGDGLASVFKDEHVK